ncbi:MAG: 4Fe-4S binding protein [Planctomycetaceae bacterium]|nr:4Fe-4S binding protein [Planctomycetaceae bacterium]
MERLFPVYTQEKVCQDCYKCVRECPVKAIRVENERAYIVADRCVACGRCIRICPSGAKLLRNDTGRVRFLLASGKPVYASIAPSWVAVHPEWTPGQFIAALRRLGFAGVSETALGAQEVSAALAQELAGVESGLHISSACPAVVDLVRKHVPDLAPCITPIASPALTHCAMLRRHFGEDIGIVFIGPCAAKKSEADRHPELMNLAITFAELDGWLAETSVNPLLFNPGPDDVFVPHSAAEGAVYPIEGGMIETLNHYGSPSTVRKQAIAGLGRLRVSLSELKDRDLRPAFFLEGLACRGGCVNGPCTTRDPSPIDGIMAVRENTRFGPPGPRPGLNLPVAYEPAASAAAKWSDMALKEALSRIGKTTPEDELNCGACGYDTCRSLARALLNGDAETSMCASYMRSIAQRKANALLRCMPSGVVIVGVDLRIIESNRPFAAIAGDEFLERFDADPGMPGAQVEDILPIGKLLRAALRSGEDIKRERLKVGDKLLTIEIFIIEEHKIVGAIVDDVTQNEMRRDQIARRAREVINRNITTVQEIACRLGEHMADTEILLSSIAEGFGEEPDREDDA